MIKQILFHKRNSDELDAFVGELSKADSNRGVSLSKLTTLVTDAVNELEPEWDADSQSKRYADALRRQNDSNRSLLKNSLSEIYPDSEEDEEE